MSVQTKFMLDQLQSTKKIHKFSLFDMKEGSDYFEGRTKGSQGFIYSPPSHPK